MFAKLFMTFYCLCFSYIYQKLTVLNFFLGHVLTTANQYSIQVKSTVTRFRTNQFKIVRCRPI